MCSIPIIIEQAGWIGERAIAKPLGTWVQIPGPPKLYLIFSSGIHVQRLECGASYASRSQLPSGHPGRSNDQG